ncbi:MAG: hypothetical protein ACREQY_06875 [Candidatus Binatia bacterium]
MLGNSPRRRPIALLAALALAACAHSVKQDKASGKDARWKGAKPIMLENNAGEATGIVTYPGGDRVDWKLVEIPEGKKGSLEIELSWKPPRPGLDLAFDVYNEWGTKLGGVKAKKPSATRKSKKKRGKKTLTLAPAKGKLYVEVYASNRGDAGKYRLKVAFQEESTATAPRFDPSTVSIPDPPKLAATFPECDTSALDKFDKNNPDCAGKSVACTKFDPNNPACAGACPDPNAPDPKVKACEQFFPECDCNAPDANNPRCKGVKVCLQPFNGLITDVTVDGGGTFIQINKGTDAGVSVGMAGEIIDATGHPVKDGEFKIFKVFKTRSHAKVKVSREAVRKTLNVRLKP